MRLTEFTQLNILRASHASIDKCGTKVSGLVKTKNGTCCGDCIHEADDACNHPVVMADPEVEKNEHGDAIVKDEWCCEYWAPRSKGLLEN